MRLVGLFGRLRFLIGQLALDIGRFTTGMVKKSFFECLNSLKNLMTKLMLICVNLLEKLALL